MSSQVLALYHLKELSCNAPLCYIMQKEITKVYGGINVRVGNLLVNRLLPNKNVQAVGSFVLLDHFYPTIQKPKTPQSVQGKFAHPNRGISTLTYILSGEMEHFDSRGNHGIVGAGGVQWMKAGSGIQQDQDIPHSFQQEGGLLHLLKFWINLPAKNKNDEPEFLHLNADEIPELLLPGDAGKMRILTGSYGIYTSPVKTFSQQFLYHIRLNPKSTFTLNTKEVFEYAAFVPADEAKINNEVFANSELIIFKQDEGDIVLYNNNISEADMIIFGGGPYMETIVAEGPFVMNSQVEIAEAYNDFHLGKYGKIKYAVKGDDKSNNYSTNV